ncbi:pyrimidine dimer DNA glycosylase/endonuclease V [Alkalibacillus silvisoli]|uniref:Pyrimidine dimer DNA glycosylase/endonuclease V n=1 Tax=Alkalibacillus silvisoli TaxID=392823 RepID=A0ABP3JH30_9BACI
MRLWSVHPKYLDSKGLVALWRETLLAQKVLLGETKGYRNHPQRIRFREHGQPVAAIGSYLNGIYEEASMRGYRFDATKIHSFKEVSAITLNTGQLAYEWEHLLKKLAERSPNCYQQYKDYHETKVKPHPMFVLNEGPVEDWERTQSNMR